MDVLATAEVPVEEMMADPAVAAMAAAGDGSDAPASLSSDPDLANLDLNLDPNLDLEAEWPVREDIISERLGEPAFASSSSSASREGFRGRASGSSSGSMDQGADADGAKLAAANKAEASAKGYGKLYGAFRGGREGLEACAAGAARPAGLQRAFITEGWPRGARGLRCGFGPIGRLAGCLHHKLLPYHRHADIYGDSNCKPVANCKPGALHAVPLEHPLWPHVFSCLRADYVCAVVTGSI